MTVKIRPARESDAPQIAAILSGWIDATGWMPRVHSHAEDRGFGEFLIAKTDVRVATAGGKTVGFLAARGPSIEALYVVDDWRGQGVGQALLDDLRTEQPELQLWTFQANDGARRFYARNGFEEVELTDGAGNDEKLPDVRLVWRKAEE